MPATPDKDDASRTGTFRVNCPSCQNPLHSRDGRIFGRTLRCPACNHRFQGPKAPAAAVPASSRVQAAAPAAPVRPPDAPPSAMSLYLSIGAAGALILCLGGAVATYLSLGSRSSDGERATPQEEARAQLEKARLATEERSRQAEKERGTQAKVAALLDAAREAKSRKAFDEAEGLYTEVLRLDPDNFVAKTGLRSVNQAQGQDAKLAAEVQGLLARGLAADKKGEHAEAIDIYAEVLARVPNDPTALKRLREAQAAREQAAKQTGNTKTVYEAHLRTGRALLNASRFADAELEYRKALASNPGGEEAAAGLEAALKGANSERAAATQAAQREAERLAKQAEQKEKADARRDAAATRREEMEATLAAQQAALAAQQQAQQAAQGVFVPPTPVVPVVPTVTPPTVIIVPVSPKRPDPVAKKTPTTTDPVPKTLTTTPVPVKTGTARPGTTRPVAPPVVPKTTTPPPKLPVRPVLPK